jgi:hypothetical protein
MTTTPPKERGWRFLKKTETIRSGDQAWIDQGEGRWIELDTQLSGFLVSSINAKFVRRKANK